MRPVLPGPTASHKRVAAKWRAVGAAFHRGPVEYRLSQVAELTMP